MHRKLAGVLLTFGLPAFVLLTFGLLAPSPALAQDDANAVQVNAMLQDYPPYAQKELSAIVDLIMQESGMDAQKNVDAYQQHGGEAALGSFSPAVRARIAALEARLAQDPSFNTPARMQRMQGQIPAFLGQPAH